MAVRGYDGMMEQPTPYERVIGGTEKEREAALGALQEMFENKSEELIKYELPKTPEDEKIIGNVVEVVDELVREYGGDPIILPLEKIHVLKPGSVFEMTDGKLGKGIHKPLSLNIGVEKEHSPLLFASHVAHELFHANSYKAARVDASGKRIRLYRSGIAMADRKDSSSKKAGEEKEYFGMMEEAIVAECTRKALEKLKEAPLFKEEAEAIQKIGGWAAGHFRSAGVPEEKVNLMLRELKYIPNALERVKSVFAFSYNERKREAYAAGMFSRLAQEKEAEPFERYEERKKLYNLLDEIVEKAGGKFKNHEKIFREFASANFSGNYMKIARLVENILGEGSFRRLADEFSMGSGTLEKMDSSSIGSNKSTL